MTKLLDRICAALAVLAAFLFIFMTFSICASIFTRSFGLPTPVWTNQFNEYAMLWMTFLGTAWLLSKDRHVSIQIILSRLNNKMKRLFRIIHNVMGFLLCAAICTYGALTTWDHFQRNVIDVQVLDVPKAWIILVIPLGFFLLMLQFLRRITEGLRGTDAENPETGHDLEKLN
ncbi:MAG: TRAP transporter small permease [Pseudomonadota bacterium]